MGLARQNAYYAIGRLLSALIGLGSLAAFTRLLSPADYGRYSIVIALGGLIAGVVFQWLRQCLVQFGGDHRQRAPLLASIGVLYLIAISITILLALVLFVLIEAGLYREQITWIEIGTVCLFAWAQSGFELSADASRVDSKPIRFGFANILRAGASLLFGAAAALLTHSVNMVICGVALGYSVAGLIAAPAWLAGLFSARLASFQQIKVLGAYGLPLSLSLGMIFILDGIDRLMLAGMRDVATAGAYSSAYNLSQFAIGTLLSGLGLAALPMAAAAFHRNDLELSKRLIEKNIVTLIAIGLPAVVGLGFLAEPLGRLLLGNYQDPDSGEVIAVVAVATGVACVRAYGFDLVFMVKQKTRTQALILTCAAASNIALNLVLIPAFGAVGPAWASLASFLLALILSVGIGRNTMKLEHSAIDIAKIILSTLPMAFVLYCTAPKSSWIFVLVSAGAGAVTYCAAMFLLNPKASRILVRSVWNAETPRAKSGSGRV